MEGTKDKNKPITCNERQEMHITKEKIQPSPLESAFAEGKSSKHVNFVTIRKKRAAHNFLLHASRSVNRNRKIPPTVKQEEPETLTCSMEDYKKMLNRLQWDMLNNAFTHKDLESVLLYKKK